MSEVASASGVPTIVTSRVGRVRGGFMTDRKAILLSAAVALGLWFAVAGWSPLVAMPHDAGLEAVRGLQQGWLREALSSTLGSVFVGFGGAFVVAILIASILSSSKFLREVFEPLLAGYGAIPRVIFFPALLSIFGLSAMSKQAMGFLSAIYPLIVTITAGIVAVPPIIRKLGDSLQLGFSRRLRLIIVPAALPSIVLAIRLGFSIALISVIISEYFAARSGLGVLLSESYARLDIDRMYAVVVSILVIVGVSNFILLSLQKRMA